MHMTFTKVVTPIQLLPAASHQQGCLQKQRYIVLQGGITALSANVTCILMCVYVVYTYTRYWVCIYVAE